MIIGETISGRIPVSEIQLDPDETSARLHADKSFSTGFSQSLDELMSTADCRFSAIRVAVSHPLTDVTILGASEIKSHSLYTALSDCGSAFMFAVTIGIKVDRLLTGLSLTSPSRHFITDALASSLTEAACNRAEDIIKGTLKCSRRFSPGYGDLPLSFQPELLNSVNAGRLLGITLNSSMLMSPLKSITAIMGVYNEQ